MKEKKNPGQDIGGKLPVWLLHDVEWALKLNKIGANYLLTLLMH
jgi:hypothetical protein